MSIDDVLKNELYGKISISAEDLGKISQIKKLFLSHGVDRNTCYKYILSLLIKFLNSNKFLEVTFILKETMMAEFLTPSIIFENKEQSKWPEKDIMDSIEMTPSWTLDEFHDINSEITYFFLLQIINRIISVYAQYKIIINEQRLRTVSLAQIGNNVKVP